MDKPEVEADGVWVDGNFYRLAVIQECLGKLAKFAKSKGWWGVDGPPCSLVEASKDIDEIKKDLL